MSSQHKTSQIQEIHTTDTKQQQIAVFVKRDDLIHPIISGNKWRKLKFNLIAAKKQNKKQIISFGGAYSNHIHALAYACKLHGFESIGIIRGEQDYQNNFTLSWARHWGMKLKFVDRKTYQQRYESSYIESLQQDYPDAYIVPEGGSNQLALPGVAEVITELNQQLHFDHLMTPVGSGGTLAGLALADQGQHNIIGVAVLKQQDYLTEQVQTLLANRVNETANWQILNQFHCGGYGKYSSADAAKIRNFSQETGVDFEPVYSGKMILAFLSLLEQGYFKKGQTVVLLHTGGMQGLGGMCERGILDKNDWPIPEFAPHSAI